MDRAAGRNPEACVCLYNKIYTACSKGSAGHSSSILVLRPVLLFILRLAMAIILVGRFVVLTSSALSSLAGASWAASFAARRALYAADSTVQSSLGTRRVVPR